MELILPEQWSREPWRYRNMLGEDTSSDMEGFAGHWPGTPGVYILGKNPSLSESISRLQGYENYHVNTKRWRGIAYDYAADQAGRKYQLRGTGQSGATSGDYDEDGIPNNRQTDAILLILGLNETPTQAMKKAFVEIINGLGGPREYIFGHKQGTDTGTSCPGPYVMRDIIDPIQKNGWNSFSNSLQGGLSMADVDNIMKELETVKKMIKGSPQRLLLRKIFDWTTPESRDRVQMHMLLKKLSKNADDSAREAAEANAVVQKLAKQQGITDEDLEEVRATVRKALTDGVKIQISLQGDEEDQP